MTNKCPQGRDFNQFECHIISPRSIATTPAHFYFFPGEHARYTNDRCYSKATQDWKTSRRENTCGSHIQPEVVRIGLLFGVPLQLMQDPDRLAVKLSLYGFRIIAASRASLGAETGMELVIYGI